MHQAQPIIAQYSGVHFIFPPLLTKENMVHFIFPPLLTKDGHEIYYCRRPILSAVLKSANHSSSPFPYHTLTEIYTDHNICKHNRQRQRDINNIECKRNHDSSHHLCPKTCNCIPMCKLLDEQWRLSVSPKRCTPPISRLGLWIEPINHNWKCQVDRI